MTQSFSLDLRVRVAAFVEAGHSCRAARHFGVSDSCTINVWSGRASQDDVGRLTNVRAASMY